MTLLEMVNRMLLRLREDQVTTVIDSEYAQLLAQFINDAKADLEDLNHTWSAYETEMDVTIDAIGTRSYDLPLTNDRSFLLRSYMDDRIPAAYDVTAGEVGQLFDCPLKVLNREYNLTNTVVDVEVPKVFAIEADNDLGDGWKLKVLWGSTTERNWKLYWYVPQADFALDGSDDNTQILLPNRPIEAQAMYYAKAERALDRNGADVVQSQQRAELSVAAALETDLQVQKKSDEIDITNKESL